MSQLASFTDFMFATRQMPLSGPDKIQNEATKYRTYLLRTMLKGMDNEKLLQSGTEIVDHIQLEINSNYQNYLPTDTFQVTGSNSLTQIKVPWRFSIVNSSWFDHEIELNNGDEKTVFKKLKKVKEQEMMTALYEGMEDDLWAAPDAAEMESGNSSGRKPYSLRCFITAAGAAPTIAGDGASTDWSTVMTVNPTAKTNWKNQVETYDNTSTTTREDTFLPAMDAMWLDVQFESPENAQQWATDTRLNKMRILTNKLTYLMLTNITRESNDRLTPAHDIGWVAGKVTYHGIPIDYIAAIDSFESTLYRARFVNFNHIYPIFHKKRYMFPIVKDGGMNQPHGHVMYRDTWRNIWCSSRRQQGIVLAA